MVSLHDRELAEKMKKPSKHQEWDEILEAIEQLAYEQYRRDEIESI